MIEKLLAHCEGSDHEGREGHEENQKELNSGFFIFDCGTAGP